MRSVSERPLTDGCPVKVAAAIVACCIVRACLTRREEEGDSGPGPVVRSASAVRDPGHPETASLRMGKR